MGISKQGGINMSTEKMEDERYNDKGIHTHSEDGMELRIICPVCGKSLTSKNLPDAESLIEEQVYLAETFQIINSIAVLKYTFCHYYDEEEDMPMEDPHEVVSEIRVEFDGSGACTAFDIVGVYCVE